MSEGLDRDNLIALLEKLGSEGDEDVLSAARAISVRVSESGQSWDELLAEPELQDEEWDAAKEVDEDDSTSSEESAAGNREALSLISKLLSKPGLYEGTRQELEDYKEDIVAGEFTGADRKYLRVLHKRVAKGK